MRICNICKFEKEEKDMSSGHASCKVCYNAKIRQRRQDRKEDLANSPAITQCQKMNVV